jgi:hypothetical protein
LRPVGAALPLLRRAARFFLPHQRRFVLIGGLYAALAAAQFGMVETATT